VKERDGWSSGWNKNGVVEETMEGEMRREWEKKRVTELDDEKSECMLKG